MKSENYLFSTELNVDVQNIAIPQIKNQDRECIEKYVEITRHLQEIYNLFHIFRFNLKNILFFYELQYDDSVVSKINHNFNECDLVKINALIISYISSAKTLVQSLETFVKENLDENSTPYKSFFKILTDEYDKKFAYRF